MHLIECQGHTAIESRVSGGEFRVLSLEFKEQNSKFKDLGKCPGDRKTFSFKRPAIATCQVCTIEICWFGLFR